MKSFKQSASVIAASLAAAFVVALPANVRADEYKLPDGAEISTFSAEALEFYSGGVASLDRADDLNAFSQLVKAAQLQPNAVRLNHLAAALATRRARGTSAAESRNHYETAIVLYETILKAGELDENFRREVSNRLKIIKDERDNIDQRDTKFDAIGTLFIQDLNRTFVAKAKEREKAKAAAAKTPAPPVGAQQPPGAYPLQPGLAGAYGQPIQPGVGVQPYPQAVGTPAAIGGAPGAYPAGGNVYPSGGNSGYFQPGVIPGNAPPAQGRPNAEAI